MCEISLTGKDGILIFTKGHFVVCVRVYRFFKETSCLSLTALRGLQGDYLSLMSRFDGI